MGITGASTRRYSSANTEEHPPEEASFGREPSRHRPKYHRLMLDLVLGFLLDLAGTFFFVGLLLGAGAFLLLVWLGAPPAVCIGVGLVVWAAGGWVQVKTGTWG